MEIIRKGVPRYCGAAEKERAGHPFYLLTTPYLFSPYESHATISRRQSYADISLLSVGHVMFVYVSVAPL